MPRELPSNIPILYEGNIMLTVQYHWLFGEHPAPEGVDMLASGFKFIEMWRDEIKQRLPRFSISLTVRPGSDPLDANVTAVNQDRADAAFLDCARLGQHVYEIERESWLVREETDEYERIKNQWLERKVARITNLNIHPGFYREQDDDPGPEAA